MIAVLIVLHVLVSVFMVLVILLQTGQAGGLSGAFGGGGSQTLFGGRGASNFLSKATAYLGAAFLVVSFLLAFAQAHRSGGGQVEGRNVIREALQPTSAPAEQMPAGEMPSGQTPLPVEGESPAPAGGETPATGSDTPPPPEPASGSGQ